MTPHLDLQGALDRIQFTVWTLGQWTQSVFISPLPSVYNWKIIYLEVGTKCTVKIHFLVVLIFIFLLHVLYHMCLFSI